MMNEEDISKRIDALMEESNMYFDAYSFDKAIALIQEAISLARSNNLTGKLVDALGTWGYYHVKEIGNIELARQCYFECIELLEASSDNKQIASYYFRIGTTHYSSDWNSLIKYYKLSLQYDSTDDDYITKSRIYEWMGTAYLALNNLELAKDNSLKAMEVYRKAIPDRSDELLWTSALDQLGKVYSLMGNEALANEYRQRSKKASDDFRAGLHKSSR